MGLETAILLVRKMTAIEDFLAQKSLSQNSQAAYRYDLEQFRQVVDGELTAEKLKVYQTFLRGLKPRAQKRKLSTINQFLYYLYETGQVPVYHKVKGSRHHLLAKTTYHRLDLASLRVKTEHQKGQLIALLITYLGLQPSELMTLESAAFDLDFKVVTVMRGTKKRLLKLPDVLVPYLQPHLEGHYLFDKSGQSYSRQWFFTQLNAFLEEIGLPDLTAQKLRDQYILSQLADQRSLTDIAHSLGLKSVTTLEKYVSSDGYKN